MQLAEDHHRQATTVRRSVVEILHKAGGGHYGGSLSVVDILLVIWRDFLVLDAARRDHFVLSKGHSAPALYCVMQVLGHLDADALENFGLSADGLPGHPEYGRPALSDFSTGSLGQGLSAAAGMALILRDHGRRAWAVLGDGECQEGQVWEAAMLAARLDLGNLIAVVDCNGHQEWGYRPDATPIPDLADKWRAFGWRVEEVDGHDPHAVAAAVARFPNYMTSRPNVVLAKTVKGRGFPLIEGDPDRFHCGVLDSAEFAACLS